MPFALGTVVLLSAKGSTALALHASGNDATIRPAAKLRQLELASTAFMTDAYNISLALTTTLLFVALGWSVSLRRRVKEQTERIRRQVEREAHLELKYTELFEHANDMVFSLDLAGRFTALNKTGERILGCTREKCLQRMLKDFVVETHLPAFGHWMAKCMAGAAPPPLDAPGLRHEAVPVFSGIECPTDS